MTRLQPAIFGSWRRRKDGAGSKARLGSRPTGANRSVLGDAKSILFGELAQGVRFGIPMEESLKMIGKSWGRHAGVPFRVELGAPDSRFPTFMFLIRLPLILLMGLWGLLWRNPSRVARITAQRLAVYVERGDSLSSAMKACGSLFNPEEIRLVKFGEEQNKLADALQSLHGFHHVERQTMVAINGLFYPVALALILVQITAFIVIKIAPKFEDIFMQLGAELPFAYQVVIHGLFGNMGAISLIAVLASMLIPILWALCCGRLLSGNIWSSYISMGIFLLGPCIFPPTIALVAVFLNMIGEVLGKSFFRQFGAGSVVLIFSVGAASVILARRQIAQMWETLLRWLEELVLRAGRYIPFLRGALRSEDDSRWLATLSVALSAGMPLPEALNEVAEVGPRGLMRKTTRLAEAVAKGLSLEAALERHRVLPRQTCYRLAWLEKEGQLATGLAEIAADARDTASATMTKASRAMEVFATMVVGIVFGSVVIVIYLPLFAIPGLVDTPPFP